MISSIEHKQSISWTFLKDTIAISAKEMPKNHTNKERFAAALSYIQTGILTLLFPRKRRRSSPSPFISHRVLEAVASWILKSLMPNTYSGGDVWALPTVITYEAVCLPENAHAHNGRKDVQAKY